MHHSPFPPASGAACTIRPITSLAALCKCTCRLSVSQAWALTTITAVLPRSPRSASAGLALACATFPIICGHASGERDRVGA
jgi:hypothetical protein